MVMRISLSLDLKKAVVINNSSFSKHGLMARKAFFTRFPSMFFSNFSSGGNVSASSQSFSSLSLFRSEFSSRSLSGEETQHQLTKGSFTPLFSPKLSTVMSETLLYSSSHDMFVISTQIIMQKLLPAWNVHLKKTAFSNREHSDVKKVEKHRLSPQNANGTFSVPYFKMQDLTELF